MLCCCYCDLSFRFITHFTVWTTTFCAGQSAHKPKGGDATPSVPGASGSEAEWRWLQGRGHQLEPQEHRGQRALCPCWSGSAAVGHGL